MYILHVKLALGSRAGLMDDALGKALLNVIGNQEFWLGKPLFENAGSFLAAFSHYGRGLYKNMLNSNLNITHITCNFVEI